MVLGEKEMSIQSSFSSTLVVTLVYEVGKNWKYLRCADRMLSTLAQAGNWSGEAVMLTKDPKNPLLRRLAAAHGIKLVEADASFWPGGQPPGNKHPGKLAKLT